MNLLNEEIRCLKTSIDCRKQLLSKDGCLDNDERIKLEGDIKELESILSDKLRKFD